MDPKKFGQKKFKKDKKRLVEVFNLSLINTEACMPGFLETTVQINQSIDGNSPYNVMGTKFRCEILDLNDCNDGVSDGKRGKFKFSMFERKNLEFTFSKQVLEYFLCFAAGKSASFMRERGNC